MEINASDVYSNENQSVSEIRAKNCYKSYMSFVKKYEEVKSITSLVTVTDYLKIEFEDLQASGAVNKQSSQYYVLESCVNRQLKILSSELTFKEINDFYICYENFIDVLNRIKCIK